MFLIKIKNLIIYFQIYKKKLKKIGSIKEKNEKKGILDFIIY